MKKKNRTEDDFSETLALIYKYKAVETTFKKAEYFVNVSFDALAIFPDTEDKKILQKIILCDVQKEIYPELEKALLNLLHTSGYPNIKFEKKVDFDELYKKQFN